MLCEEPCGVSTDPARNGRLHGRDVLHGSDHWTEPSKRTLYASLWHCVACGRSVRVYSRLAEVISGSVRKDCPACGDQMEAGPAPEADHQADFSTRTVVDRLKPTSAWAA